MLELNNGVQPRRLRLTLEAEPLANGVYSAVGHEARCVAFLGQVMAEKTGEPQKRSKLAVGWTPQLREDMARIREVLGEANCSAIIRMAVHKLRKDIEPSK